MISQEWGFVALENGIIQVGIISEYYLLGERVLRIELPRPHKDSFCEYHKMKDVKGIRVADREECESYFPKLMEYNTKIKQAINA